MGLWVKSRIMHVAVNDTDDKKSLFWGAEYSRFSIVRKAEFNRGKIWRFHLPAES